MKKNNTKKPIIEVLIGLPGSGKSTYANDKIQEINWMKISRDDIRKSLKNKWWIGPDIEPMVSRIQDATIKSVLKEKVNIVLDNTHCKSAYIKEIITKYGKEAEIVLKVIGGELSLDEIKERDKERDKVVGDAVIDGMYASYKNVIKTLSSLRLEAAGQLTIPEVASAPKRKVHLQDCIIVDIDGTVAHMNGKRGPYEWHNVGLDDPDNRVLDIIEALSLTYKVFFVSGRDGSCREQTEAWLDKHFRWRGGTLNTYTLFMRPAGNFEKDNIIKRRIYNEQFRDKYNVIMVFDDRQQVVDMWRNELGLTVAQVAYGDF